MDENRTISCAACGSANKFSAKFCRQCGGALGAVASVPSLAEGESATQDGLTEGSHEYTDGPDTPPPTLTPDELASATVASPSKVGESSVKHLQAKLVVPAFGAVVVLLAAGWWFLNRTDTTTVPLVREEAAPSVAGEAAAQAAETATAIPKASPAAPADPVLPPAAKASPTPEPRRPTPTTGSQTLQESAPVVPVREPPMPTVVSTPVAVPPVLPVPSPPTVEVPIPTKSPELPAAVPPAPPPVVAPRAAEVTPAADRRTIAAPEPYGGPLSGTLTYTGPPVVQNGEVVFRNLPPATVQLELDYDRDVWEGRLSPGDGNTRRLILRNKKPGTQKKCVVEWRVISRGVS